MEVLNYLFYSITFLFAALIAFFIPGNLFVKNFKASSAVKISLSIGLGISLWALQGFIFGYLGLRWLTYIYLLISTILWIKIVYSKHPKFKLHFSRKQVKANAVLISIFLTGVFLQILSIIGNAIPVGEGLYFCCGGADAIYHGALSKELVSIFPPYEPGITGIFLKNYHFLSNLVVSDLVRIFRLPLLSTEFQLMPILMSFLFGLSAYAVASVLGFGKNYKIFFLILIFFFSDIFYLLTLVTTQKLDFSVGTIETSLSLWVSYTRYFGVVLFFQALSFLTLWIRNKNLTYLLPLIITGGLLIGFKVYIGLLFLTGIASLALYFLAKKEKKSFISLIPVFLLSALVYLPINSSSGGLIFTGLWKSRDLISSANLNLSHLELARRIFADSGNFKSYIFDVLFLLIYIFFSFGILLASFFNPIRNTKRIPVEINIFLISGLIVTLILGMFFIQETGGANSGQFLISVFLICSIYSALLMDSMYKSNKLILKIFVVILLLIMLPKTIYISYLHIVNLQAKNGLIVSHDILNAYEFINNEANINSVVVTHPGLSNSCLLLPLLTHLKPYYCSDGAPSDRGIDVKYFSKNISYALVGRKVEGKYDYIITFRDSKPVKNMKTIYQNSTIKIIKNE